MEEIYYDIFVLLFILEVSFEFVCFVKNSLVFCYEWCVSYEDLEWFFSEIFEESKV